MKKTCAVVVTYNRKKLLLENIKMLFEQTEKVDKIIIIDNNGSDNTKEYLENNNIDFNCIEYIYLSENIGGAGGFHEGVKKAYELGFEWIILMDDDGKPYNNNTFEELFKKIKDNKYDCNEKIMYNSLVIENPEQLSFSLNGEKIVKNLECYIEKDIIKDVINPFNGTLISRGLIKEIGYPNKEFFIKGDEADYLARALAKKAEVATVVSSLYYHPSVKVGKKLKLGNSTYNIYIEAPWKEYYNIRNYTYMYKRDKKNKEAIKLLLKRFISIAILKCKKINTIKMVIKGYKDGISGKLGAIVKP